ncbi:MAG: hypothetical protein JW774_03150 [Candidatus Aureabacteria bacterium]|nr:hypothetical protein [Candidatus Auribacterota bacterium]
MDPYKVHIRTPLINEAIERFKPNKMIDIGCNAGLYSLIAVKKGIQVLAFDFDEEAVDKLYATVKTHYKDPCISTAVKDVKQECSHPGDLALALALTHHLSLSQRFPFSFVTQVLSSYTSNVLITEFMPNGLGTGKTGPVPDPLPEHYTLQNFTDA